MIMFDDLIALFSGWYYDYIEDVVDLIRYRVGHYEYAGDGVYDYIENYTTPEVWSAFVPWEQIIAAVVLICLVCALFKLLRSVLCKIL